VWPFPTFHFTYYYFVEDIMGSGASLPAVSKKNHEIPTVHPRIETHGIKETTLGFIFSLINIHINCALGTILFAFCFLVCVLLCYLGYRQFCHPGKKNKGTAPPTTCVTCWTCPSSTSLRPAWDKEAMEDRYYAFMQCQNMRYEDDDFGFAAPLPQRYQKPRQPHYNRGRIVDYIDHEPVVAQLRQLLQAAPLQVAQVHQVQPPAAPAQQLLNLGNNAVAAP
jgi:hypothetical protein